MRACVYTVYVRAYTPYARVRIRHIRALIIGRGNLAVFARCRGLTSHYYIKYRSFRINALAQEAAVLTPSSSYNCGSNGTINRRRRTRGRCHRRRYRPWK